jgi:hypothetical protein
VPSSRRRSQPDSDPPVFFIDRGLGRHHVPGVFVDAGLDVVLMADLYPCGADQSVPDDRWIADVSALGWVALTKDANLTRDHVSALSASTLRVFALDNANITGEEMARRFRVNLQRILQRARKRGPYVDIVHKDRIERRWPPLTRSRSSA